MSGCKISHTACCYLYTARRPAPVYVYKTASRRRKLLFRPWSGTGLPGPLAQQYGYVSRTDYAITIKVCRRILLAIP